MSCFQILPIDNSIVIQVGSAASPLRNSVTETADTAATIGCTLLDAAGDEVVGETWPVSLAHDSGGIYRATLPGTLSLTHGNSYTAVISGTGSGGEAVKFEVDCVAQIRGR
jgi:hypothetical protein